MEAATAFREALCFSWSSYDFLNPSVLATANAVSTLASMIPVVLPAASVAGSAVDVLDVEELDVVLDSVAGACVLEAAVVLDAVDALELDVEVPLEVLEADVDEDDEDEDTLDVVSVVELLGVDEDVDVLTEVEDAVVAADEDADDVEVELVADVVEDDAVVELVEVCEVVDDAVEEEVLLTDEDVDEPSGRTCAEAVLVEELKVAEDDVRVELVRVELSLACVIVMAAAKSPHAHAHAHAHANSTPKQACEIDHKTLCRCSSRQP